MLLMVMGQIVRSFPSSALSYSVKWYQKFWVCSWDSLPDTYPENFVLNMATRTHTQLSSHHLMAWDKMVCRNRFDVCCLTKE